MKTSIFASLCAAAGLLVSGSAFAASSQIGVVNVQQVFNASPSVQAQKAQLMNQFKGDQADLQAGENQLNELTDKYKKNASVMTQSEKHQLQIQIAQQQAKLMTMNSHFEDETNNAQQAAMNSFLDHLKTAASAVAKKDGLVMILPENSVIWSDSSLDVTKEVEAEFNKS